MARLKLRLAAAAIAAAGLFLFLYFGRPLWLGALGSYLVKTDAPFHADIAVVLGGDDTGRRVLKAAEMVEQGWAPAVLVSGPKCCYGRNESDLAIPYAVARGYPPSWFIDFPMPGQSTREEARYVAAELRRRGVRRFLVVTSDYHTRRAARMWALVAPRQSFRVIAACDEYFSPRGWWHSREGEKKFAIEWLKTVATWIGL